MRRGRAGLEGVRERAQIGREARPARVPKPGGVNGCQRTGRKSREGGVVGVPRFELGTSSSRTKRSAKLSYTPWRGRTGCGVQQGSVASRFTADYHVCRLHCWRSLRPPDV